MQSNIDISYLTLQADAFKSGLVAKLGPAAFTIWTAIKMHADYTTGECWPGIRKIGLLTGLSKSTAAEAIQSLLAENLVRVKIDGRKRGRTLVARERLDVKIGKKQICSIVLDYVPRSLNLRLKQLREGFIQDDLNDHLLNDCEIIPAPDFQYKNGKFVAKLKPDDLNVPITTAPVCDAKLKGDVFLAKTEANRKAKLSGRTDT